MNQKEILRAFLIEKLAERGWTLNEDILDLLHRHIELEAVPPNATETYRTITLRQERDGTYSGKSYKLTNIKQLNLYQLLDSAYDVFEVSDAEEWEQMIFSLGELIIDLYPKFTIHFNERETKIMRAIAALRTKQFSEEEIMQKYLQEIGEPLAESDFNLTMEYFKEFDIVKETAPQQYQLREKIKNKTRKD